MVHGWRLNRTRTLISLAIVGPLATRVWRRRQREAQFAEGTDVDVLAFARETLDDQIRRLRRVPTRLVILFLLAVILHVSAWTLLVVRVRGPRASLLFSPIFDIILLAALPLAIWSIRRQLAAALKIRARLD